MNLLEETLNKLKLHNKTINDVLWCGCDSFYFDWKTFEENANFDYDDGSGSAKIAQNLVIVGKDFWLERKEDEWAEWWEFKEFPKKPNQNFSRRKIKLGDNEVMWESLEDLNK